MKDNYEKIKEKESELNELYLRQDEDHDLVNLDAYVLEDANGKKIPNAVSTTLNDPAVFAARVESALNMAVEQVTVESEDKKVDTGYVEDVIKACFGAADELAVLKQQWPLNPYIDQQMCRRGRGVVRCLFRMKDGVLIPDLTKWDSRKVAYDVDDRGLDWGSYRMVKTKAQIEAEDWAKKKEFTIAGKSAECVEYWDSKVNEIYVDGVKKWDLPNPYGYPPLCIQTVTLGSMLSDADEIKYQGESIFFLIRDLIPELNRLASIIQSLNLKALDAALQWESKSGEGGTPPDYNKLTGSGNVTAVDEGGGAKPVPYGELRQSAMLLHQMIETRIQRGSLSNFDMGTFDQPMSAVALVTIGEGRGQVEMPRLGARGLLKQQLANMIISQLLSMGERQIEIGTLGHKQSWDLGKLKGAFGITYKYFTKSPKLDVARLSMARAAMDVGYDPETVFEDILQVEDVDEMMRKRYFYMAEELSPNVKINRTIIKLLDMAERGDEDAERDAQIMATELGVSLEQVKQGALPNRAMPERGKGSPLVPLLEGAGGIKGATTSAKKSAELQGTPQGGE